MTGKPPYDGLGGSDLTLRDELAIDRTLLANERTLLAYVRTALALIIVGLTFLHFVPSGFLRIVGMAAIPAGILAGAIGTIRYRRINRAIHAVRKTRI